MASVTGSSPERTERSSRHRRRATSSRSFCSLSQDGVGRGRFRRREVSGAARFIVVSLGKVDLLWLLVPHLHPQGVALRGDGEVPVSELPHQVEWLSRLLLECEAKRVVRDRLLDYLPHLRHRAKETVRWDDAPNSLVRTFEVVAVNEELRPLQAVVEVVEDGSAEVLVPERLPEALHLPHRLRVVRSALHVVDAVAAQFLLEVRLATPRRVLPALVRQYFARRAVSSNAAVERLEDERRLLVVRHRVRHHEARVVVEKGRHIDALAASQQEREDVR